MAAFATEVDDPFAHNVWHAWEANWGRAVNWEANDAPANGPPTRQANDAPAWQANDAPASQSSDALLQQQFKPLSQIFAQAINHLYMGHAFPQVADPNLGPPKAAPAGPPAGPPAPVPVVPVPVACFPQAVRQYPAGPPVAFPYPAPVEQLDSAPQAVPCVPPLPGSVQPEPQAGPPVLFDDVYLNTPEFSTLAPEVQLFLKSLKKQ
jgi:hypothetical protein